MSLRFVLPGGMGLVHEVEQWDFDGDFDDAGELWVLVPQLDRGITEIWMEYGHPAPIPPASPGTVWPDALGVWHLDTADPTDSTPNLRHGTPSSTEVDNGAVGRGHSYDGTAWDELSRGGESMGSSMTGTVQLWFRGDGSQNMGIHALFHGAADIDADLYGGEHELYLATLQPARSIPRVNLSAYSPDDGDPDMHPQQATTSVNGPWLNNEWHHIAATWENGGIITLLIDGDKGIAPGKTTMNVEDYDFTAWVRVGHPSVEGMGSNRGWTGLIDEVRLYDFAFSPERALIEWMAQREDFASIGASQMLMP